MPYRIDPDRDRQRRAELLERHAANRRQAAALADELTSLGARSRALRDQLEAIRGEYDGIERELAVLSGQPFPPPQERARPRTDQAHEARSGALFFGLAVAGAAALVTAVTLIGTRTIASAALADGWERWGFLAMRAEAPVAVDPPRAPSAVDHGAMQHAFGGEQVERPRRGHRHHRHRSLCLGDGHHHRPMVVDREGDVRVVDRDVLEEAMTSGSPFSRDAPIRVTDGQVRVRASVGSLLHELGLRTGDRLLSLNGYELSDPDRALEAYGSLRNDALVDLRIERDGHPKQLLFAFTKI